MSQQREWSKTIGAACGVLFVVLLLAGDTAEKPEAGATDAQIAAFYEANPPTTATWLGVFMEAVALLALLVFMMALGNHLLTGNAGTQIFARVAMAAGIATVAVKFASFPAVLLVFERSADGQTLDPAITGTLIGLNDIAFRVTWLTIAAFLVAVAAASWTRRAIPRWLAAFALIDAIALLQGFADTTNPLGVFAFLGFLLWTLITSVVLVLRAWRRPAAATPAGAPRSTAPGAARAQ